MRDNPYKDLPPLERKPDGSLYRMTPAQRKQANALIRRECCNYEGRDCIALDAGDAHTCPQTISFSVCCKWFRWAVLPQDGTPEAEIFRGRDLKRCAVCGGVFVPKSNRAKYCPDCASRVHRRQKAESERKRRSSVDNQAGAPMFIGRQQELNTLHKLYNSGKFEFAVIYGRRRVGKTALISEFTKDKATIFFTGVETNAKQNLDNFSRCIMEYNTGITVDSSFASFQSALEYVFELAKTKGIVLVIDEYPYVAHASKSLASTLQLLIDKNKDRSKLFLILCGSSMSYMEDHVLAYKAPLYGRRTAQFKINPFDFFEARRYFTKFSDIDKALAYGVVGGTPQYLMQIDDSLSIEENIKNTHLNPSSSIFEEPNNLLKQEVREPSIYNAVITAIAAGCSKMNEISNKIDEDTSVCATYIKNLIALGIVKKESPYGEKSSRKTIYSIEDNMFRFWYRFVPENTSIISRGATDLAYKRIAPEIPSYMGGVFEKICKQYLWKLLLDGKCAVNFNDLGRWWGTNSKTKMQEEIDIMGTDKDSALFAECKWTNEKIDLGVLETLVARSNLFNYKKKHFYLFAKTGFSKGCMDKAEEMGNVTLVEYSDMLNQ